MTKTIVLCIFFVIFIVENYAVKFSIEMEQCVQKSHEECFFIMREKKSLGFQSDITLVTKHLLKKEEEDNFLGGECVEKLERFGEILRLNLQLVNASFSDITHKCSRMQEWINDLLYLERSNGQLLKEYDDPETRNMCREELEVIKEFYINTEDIFDEFYPVDSTVDSMSEFDYEIVRNCFYKSKSHIGGENKSENHFGEVLSRGLKRMIEYFDEKKNFVEGEFFDDEEYFDETGS